jgi:hypothetical protein
MRMRFMGSANATLRAHCDHEPRRDELRESVTEDAIRGLVELGPPENRFMGSCLGHSHAERF